ncbi:hypothetical protein ACF1GW_30230 [Streptomyces achromogenes]
MKKSRSRAALSPGPAGSPQAGRARPAPVRDVPDRHRTPWAGAV